MPYTPLPPVPQRNQPATFADLGDAFLGALPQFGDDMEAVRLAAVDAIAAAPGAIAAAQFKGEYAAGTTYQVGHSVSYSGNTWFAKTINTGVTPVAGANWQRIVAVAGTAGHAGKFLFTDGADTQWKYADTPGTLAVSYDDLTADGWVPADGASYLQSAYPALFTAIGQPDPFSSNALKLSAPATLPTGQAKASAFSTDGVYLAIAHNTTPFVTIYKRAGDVFTKLADPATLPAGGGTDVAFSADGVYLAVACVSTPFITIYKRSGDVFTKLADPATLPTGTGYAPAFSPDGVYLAVAHNTTPFITIYKRSGDVFTKLANPATLPTAGGGLAGVTFSADGVYLAVAHGASPFITIYKRAGDVFTKLADPATLPTGTSNGAAFSPSGEHLAVSHTVTPFITIYKRAADVFTKLANPATLPASGGSDIAFSPSGAHLAFSGGSAVVIYKRASDVFTRQADPDTPSVGNGTGVAFSPGGEHLAVSGISSPYVAIYRDYSFDKATEFTVPAAALLTDERVTKSAKTFIKAL